MNVYTAPTTLLVRCMEAGRLNQRGVAQLLGVSTRTISRWLDGEQVLLLENKLHALARATFARDRALSAELAKTSGTTLEALGLVEPRPTATSTPTATPTVRPLVAAAFARAWELRLSTEAVARGFAETTSTPKEEG